MLDNFIAFEFYNEIERSVVNFDSCGKVGGKVPFVTSNKITIDLLRGHSFSEYLIYLSPTEPLP